MGEVIRFKNAWILPDGLCQSIARDLGELRIDVFDPAISIGDDDRHRTLLDSLKQLPQVGL